MSRGDFGSGGGYQGNYGGGFDSNTAGILCLCAQLFCRKCKAS